MSINYKDWQRTYSIITDMYFMDRTSMNLYVIWTEELNKIKQHFVGTTKIINDRLYTCYIVTSTDGIILLHYMDESNSWIDKVSIKLGDYDL